MLIFAALWLLFESVISLLATCEPPHHAAADYSKENHCTFFSGPLSLIIYSSGVAIFQFLHSYEKQLVAGFTIILAISTIGLWLATWKLWAVTERSLVELEGASVFVKVTNPGFGKTERGYSPDQLNYCFVNYGRSAAFITAYNQRIRMVRPQTGSPEPFNMETDLVSVPWGFVVPPNGGKSQIVSLNCLMEIRTDEFDLLNDRRNVIFFMVGFKYMDSLRTNYTSAVCLMYDDVLDDFILTRDREPRNFHRKETSQP